MVQAQNWQRPKVPCKGNQFLSIKNQGNSELKLKIDCHKNQPPDSIGIMMCPHVGRHHNLAKLPPVRPSILKSCTFNQVWSRLKDWALGDVKDFSRHVHRTLGDSFPMEPVTLLSQ